MKYSILNLALSFLMLFAFNGLSAQNKDTETDKTSYGFDTKIEIPVTPVKDQHRSGTCWSFAATSFLEAELLRISGDEYDLSEMYFVRYSYENKALDYVRRHGKANFSPGGQAHDVFDVIREYGMVSENGYPGLTRGEEKHNHSELDAVLSGFVSSVVQNKARRLSEVWFEGFGALLDVYMGSVPEKQSKDFVEIRKFNPEDYVELTSYNCYEWYENVNLQIPDNWSYSSYVNVPLDEMMEVINYAFENGYSVCWDGDVSSRGFSHRNGVAIVPEEKVDNMAGTEQSRWEAIPESERADKLYAFEGPVPEQQVDDNARMEVFANYTSTDDHLMHLTGVVEDHAGNIYYRTKNSWDTDSNEMGGYLNMSEAYVRLNTVAIMVHKDAVPKRLQKKFGL
jgi:bleomycin hydrolase